MYSKILVTLQFALLGVIIWYCRFQIHSPLFLFVSILSGVIGIWAIVVMELPNLKIRPEPKKDAKLRTSGPYRVIRHPMYTSVLLLAASFTFERADIISISLFILLSILLLLKTLYEEKLLENKFPEYSDYRKRTWRLIPFIF